MIRSQPRYGKGGIPCNTDKNSKAHSKEEEGPKLSGLPADFFREAEACIQELEEECQACGPRTTEGKMIKDMIDRADSDIRGIHMLRVRKIMSRDKSHGRNSNRGD